ncbi:GSU3473 family protein [Desulfuromonas sp.]|uniref:GSU3473 family protein n=1 Tax=Desulfuromonas sp. TaxID=892 RepID=UPI0025C15F1C|nr:hypothetical protein [Desulfuromonas sp.]
MMIRIMYHNGKHDLVKTSALERLISSNQVKQFQRSSGWVTPSRDPVRRTRNSQYRGMERREAKSA